MDQTIKSNTKKKNSIVYEAPLHEKKFILLARGKIKSDSFYNE